MHILVRFLLFLLITTVVEAQTTEANTIAVEIINISNEDGQVLIGLYSTEDSWLNKPYKGAFSKIENGTGAFEFVNIPDGIYAISVFHDEDNDGELDTLFGIPREDTGSSNDAPARFGPPKWEDAKFEVKGGNIKQIITL